MAIMMTEEEYHTPKGRRDARRSLFWHDHGFLRVVFDNSYQISDKMWRTFQPSPEHLKKWKQRGIRTVINLRGRRHEEKQDGLYFLEEETCATLGMNFIPFQAFSREAPSRDFIVGIDQLFNEIEYPALMHCKSGADRAGVASTLYQFLHAKKPLDEALEQLSFKYGHVKQGKTGIIDYFFDLYKKAADEEGVPPSREHLLEFVNGDYDHKKIKQDFKPTPIGSLLTEIILRRE
ncbi:MAG: fused DSP-PTPase phosphatase/NAD kinase-like protein [bacterium]